MAMRALSHICNIVRPFIRPYALAVILLLSVRHFSSGHSSAHTVDENWPQFRAQMATATALQSVSIDGSETST